MEPFVRPHHHPTVIIHPGIVRVVIEELGTAFCLSCRPLPYKSIRPIKTVDKIRLVAEEVTARGPFNIDSVLATLGSGRDVRVRNECHGQMPMEVGCERSRASAARRNPM